MRLNCKEGDLAVVVRSDAGNEGKIVRCVRFLGERPYVYRDGTRENVACWEIDKGLPGWGGEVGNNIEDFRIRPIHGDEGEDEMLRIAGRPDMALKTANEPSSAAAQQSAATRSCTSAQKSY